VIKDLKIKSSLDLSGRHGIWFKRN
jgi:hypothetical protein